MNKEQTISDMDNNILTSRGAGNDYAIRKLLESIAIGVKYLVEEK